MTEFTGFPPALPAFLRALRDHADRDWFAANRSTYRDAYDRPAKALVTAIGHRLSELSHDLHAVPAVGGSIFRVNRDRRFSPDATPYKGYLDLWFWEGDRALAPGGLYLRLTPDTVRIAAGARALDRAALARYRRAVLDPVAGPALAAVAADLDDHGTPLEGRTLVGLPRGTPVDALPDATGPDDPRLDLLRHTAVTAEVDHPADGLVTDGPALIDAAMSAWTTTWRLHRWVVDHVQTVHHQGR